MTLSFHKVMFSAQEVLDMLGEFEPEPNNSLGEFTTTFLDRAEARSRQAQEPLVIVYRGS